MAEYMRIFKIKIPFFIMLFTTNFTFFDCISQPKSLVTSQCPEKLPENFSLILSFDSSYSGRVIILYNKEKRKTQSDTSIIKDNKCLFTGTLTEPAFLYIEFPDMVAGLREFYRTCIISNGNQRMNIDANRLEESFIQGNLNDSALLDFRRTINPLEKELRRFEQLERDAFNQREIRDSIRLLKDAILKGAIEKFILYKNYWVSGYILYSIQYDLSPEKLKDLYSTLSDEIKCSLSGIEVSNNVQRQVGNIAPDFFAVSSTENKIQFSKISSSSNLTLLFFWATWCVPCKVLLPHLDTLQKKYGSIGLSIIAVANDDEKRSTWLNAIQSLKIDYMTHILQRFGKEDDIGRLFATMAIPVVILVDNHGKIIYRVLGTEIEPMKDFIDLYFQNID